MNTDVLYFWEETGELTLESKCNPYAPLLDAGLRNEGFSLLDTPYTLRKQDLEGRRDSAPLLHLNWLAPFYSARDSQEAQKRASHFMDLLAFARSQGYGIVWTFHNIFPHERPFPEIDKMVRFFAAQTADAIIAHCEYAADQCRRLFQPRGPVHVIPHGSFIGAYTNEVTPARARERFGLRKEDLVYAYFGNPRGYKGLDDLLDAFLTIDAPEARLLLFLRCPPPVVRSCLRRHAGRLKRWLLHRPEHAPTRALREAVENPRIIVHTAPWIEADDFQYIFGASDVVVLPFKKVLTSSSVILALSFGKPVVVPRLGCLPELVDDHMAALYDPSSPEGLGMAMRTMQSRDLASAGESALARARSLDWQSVGAQMAEVYRQVLSCRGL